MSSIPYPELVEEALRDCLAFDNDGQLAAAIKRVSALASSAGQGNAGVERRHLALLITGDENACEALANAYTKALYGLGLIDGKAGNPSSESIDWTGHICDNEASRTMQEQSWARRKMQEAGKAARSGTLVIRDIYRKPYEGSPDEDEAAPNALKGGVEALAALVTEDLYGTLTPVVVLTGPDVETRTFLADTPDLSNLFNGKSAKAEARPPLPEVYSTELESRITARRPLAFKLRSA